MLMLYKQTDKKIQGFTLIEVLIATFILAIGIFGVMALIPVGIHQTDTIAKKTIVATSSEIPLAYTEYKYPAGNTSGNHSIQYILYTISGTTTPSIYYFPLNDVISLTGTPLNSYGNPSYGWSMSLVPIDINGDGSTTSVEESFLFRQQIAIFNNYTTNTGAADFAYGSTLVSNVTNINKISVNNFICNSQNHIWYRVTGINKSNNTVTIRQPYEYGTASASYISTNTLVGLYNTVLTPREWRIKSGGGGGDDHHDDDHHDEDDDRHEDSDER